MSWRCGIGPLMDGGSYLPAHVVCNGCKAIKIALTKRGDMPMWALHQKAPPGWALFRETGPDGRVRRIDLCPRCRVALEDNP